MITRPDLSDAEACAKGHRQFTFIRELAAVDRVPIYLEPTYGYISVLTYGQSKLPHSSFNGLRKRLKEAGFEVTIRRPSKGSGKLLPGWVAVNR